MQAYEMKWWQVMIIIIWIDCLCFCGSVFVEKNHAKNLHTKNPFDKPLCHILLSSWKAILMDFVNNVNKCQAEKCSFFTLALSLG